MSDIELTRRVLEACRDGNLNHTKHLLELGGDPSQLLMYGDSHPTMINALHLTCMLGNLDALKILSKYSKRHKFEVKSGQLGLTPLHYACLYGHFEIIQYLCSNEKCNPHSKTFHDNTALHMACSCSSLDVNTLKIVRYLVKVANCDVNAVNSNGFSPLMVLLQHGQCITVARYLIFECSCNLWLQNKSGNTALHIASSSGDYTLVQELLKSDGGLQSTMISNTLGDIPLHLACLHSHVKCAELLVEANLDGLHAKNNSNLIPLQYALQKSKLALMLITKMENYLDKNGNSLLHIACLIPDITLANITAKLTLNPNIANHDGDTPLHLACRYNKLKRAEILLDLKGDVNIQNEAGETALTIASAGNNFWLVKLFHQREKRSSNGESPFFIACKVGNVELVDQMIIAGLDFCETNDIGETPIQTAINHGHTPVVELLTKKPSELSHMDEITWYYKRGINPTLMLTAPEYLLQLECQEYKDNLLLTEIPLKYSEKARLNPLHYACYYGHICIIKYLVNALFCDPNMKIFDSGLTPLHLSCMAACSAENSLRIVRFLTTEVACNCNSQTLSGDTPLMVLLNHHNDWNRLIQYLVNDCLCDLQLTNNRKATALHIACAKSSTEAVKIIIKAGVDLDIRDETDSTPLHIACKGNNEDLIKLILSKLRDRVDVVLDILHRFHDRQQVIASVTQIMHAHKDCYGNTPLHIICIKDNTDLARLVAKTMCNPNVQNVQCDTPLHIVCRNSCSTMAEIILSMKNCDVNIKNIDGDTPLHLACRNGDMHIIEMLLKNLPDLFIKNAGGHTPINEVIHPHCLNMEIIWHMLSHNHKSQVCDLSMVKCLVKEIDVSEFFKPDIDDKKNILHVLCGQAGDIHALMFFLQASDSFLTSQDKQGWTPLHYACYYGHQSIAAYLIKEYNCNSLIKTLKGETPLHLACTAVCSEEIALGVVKFLTLGCKHDVNMRCNGTTLLMYLLHHRPAAVNIAHHLIVECQCDLSLKNNDGDTALHIACMTCNTEVARLIIKAGGGNITSITNQHRDTPLHLACKFGYNDIVQLLISSQPCCLYEVNEARKKDIEAVKLLAREGNSDIKDSKGWTPLHHACLHGNFKIVTHLIIEAKCNPNLATPNGTLPLQLACSGNCSEECALKIVKFLVDTAKCDPDATTFNGDTFLIYLLKTKCTKMSILKFLIMSCHCSVSTRSRSGDTALHIVCSYTPLDLETKALEVINMMAMRDDCDANITNGLFNTPLHLACINGKPLIVEALISKFGGKCGLHEVNKVGHLPLTIAFDLRHHSIASMLIAAMYSTRDKHGNTPLHIACINENVLLAQYIVANEHCIISAINSDGDTALHMAVRTGDHKLVKVILKICDITTLHLCNHSGENPLHVACKAGDSLLFQELLRIKSSYSDRNDDNILHLACEYGHAHIVDIILRDMTVNVNSKDSSGETVLHTVCKSGNNKIFTLLRMLSKGIDMTATDEDGNTPLHLACKTGSLEICEEILKKGCNINTKNTLGDAPLFIACRYCHFDILQLLINEPEIKINERNNNGETILHILCRSPQCESAMVRYALEITQINPNVSNMAGETPIQLTSNHHIIHELIRFGADPTDVYASKVHLDVKNPPQPVVKVFIVGNPSVGKSTLTSALKVELSRLAKVFTPPKPISGVEQGTAGIIPHEFDSKMFGSVTLYDFAGHREFYSSHSALIQNSTESSPPIFLVVVDLRESYQTLKSNILYWLTFLGNQINVDNHKKPHIIIVGSHADIIKSNKQELQEKEEIIKHIKGLDYLSSVEIHGFVTMDCQYSQSSGMTKLRHYIRESCEDLRVDSNMKFNAHCCLVYLYDRFKDSTAIKLDQVVQIIRKDKGSVLENNPLFFLPESLQHLFDLCYELHDRGHILLLKDKHTPLNSWIVIDKVSLLSEVTGSIFAPEKLRKYCNLASNTGVVPLNRLSAMFSKYDTDMLIGYLVHLEFCHEISDNEILQLIDTQIQDYTSAEVYYFFPALVQLKAPNHLWAHKPHHMYYCGWILKCSRPGQFFTSRFLEVLILRLAFSFALIATSDDASTTIPVLQRKCSVWKNGLFWGDNNGVEALFEVAPDNKSVVVLMRCTMRQALKPYLQLRASIICKVLAAVSEFCAKVEISECFIDPSEAQKYPVTASQFYSIKEISSVIIKGTGGSFCIVSGAGESLPLATVLTFEPYSLLGGTIIARIFGSDNAARKEMPDHEVSKLAHLISSSDSAVAFASLFDETVTTPPSSGQMLSILKQWRIRSDGTYLSLHQKLDPFSIFSTRNPGILAEISLPDILSEICIDENKALLQQRDKQPQLHQLEQLTGSDGSKSVQVINSVAAKWEELAIALGFDAPAIAHIKRDHSTDCREACSQMLQMWLRMECSVASRSVSWATLIHCLKDAEFSSIGQELEEILNLEHVL